MQFVNSIILVIRKFSSALWLTLLQILEAMTDLAVKTGKLGFQFSRYVINVIYRTYGVCREYITLFFVRVAKFLTSIWQLYILIFVFVLLGFLLKRFFGTPGVIATIVIASLLIAGAIYNIVRNNSGNDEADDIGAWDGFAKTDFAKYSFNGVIFVGLAISAFWFRDALPQPPHLQYVKSYFFTPTVLDGYAEKCEANDLTACTFLGISARKGQGMEVDLDKAFELLTKACDGGAAKGCAALADMYDAGSGVKQDRGRATELYQRSCTGGYELGCSNLGVGLMNGLGVKRNPGRALALWTSACSNGLPSACYNFALQLRSGVNIKRDNKKAAILLTKGCGLDHYLSCRESGNDYFFGIGAARDYVRALPLFSKACDGGIGAACTDLGYMYSKALGTPVNAKLAAQLYSKACEIGNMQGCLSLGVLTEAGRGTAADAKLALTLYAKACDGGATRACPEQRRLAKRNPD